MQAQKCCVPTEVFETLKKMGYEPGVVAQIPASILREGSERVAGNPMGHAELKEGEVVLDMGTGSGLDCFYAARKVGPTGKVISVSNSERDIAQAEENKRRLGAENVELHLAQLEDLPLDDESVDVAVANCVCCVMRGDERVLRETFRVLKPGGRFVTTADETLDPKLRAVGFEVTNRSGNIVIARKPCT